MCLLTLKYKAQLHIKKAWAFCSDSFIEYGGEGGIRTLDTFSRIHTFQACSFSLSDTSPYFVVAVILFEFIATTGRYYREKQNRRQQADDDFFKLFD